MRVVVLFERSGIVRDAFRRRGHDAWSCDIESCESDPAYHYQMDAFECVEKHGPFDLGIAHPNCTHLSVSGAHLFKAKQADGRQGGAIADFMRVTELRARGYVKRLAIENPISIMSSRWRKPDQIIQPYQFGDDASKRTCLWLDGLPPLALDKSLYVEPRYVCGCGWSGRDVRRNTMWGRQCPECLSARLKPRWANQTDSGQNRLGPSERRAMDRARTYPGIANAWAQQWGCLL